MSKAPRDSKTPRDTHHHGSLRNALVESGIEMLESGEAFTLRAVARRVGVSQTAPYRHFPDKEHLEAAMAAHGFRTLQTRLNDVLQEEGGHVAAVDLALTYVRYAVEHPALYRLMFAQPCGENDERLAASSKLFELVQEGFHQATPAVPAHALATAGWALAHGLASLYLDGKLLTDEVITLEQRVRAAFAAAGALE